MKRKLLFKDHHFLVCPAKHPLAKKRRVTWSEVRVYPFITLTRDFTSRLLMDLGMWSQDLHLEPAYEVTSLTTALSMVASGLDIAACPSYSVPLAKAWNLKMIPLSEPEFVRDICAFMKSSAPSNAAAAAASFMEQALIETRKGR